MDDVAIARAIHVLAVIVWIGGVAMVTTVIFPLIRRTHAAKERLRLFESVERRFIWQARIATLLVAASGFYMIQRMNLWDRFRSAAFWWMHAMIGVWAIFTVILFIAEPLIIHEWVQRRALKSADATFALLHRLHWILLLLGLVTAFAAVAGSYGMVLVP
ncbi:MAG TPA: hypothetical protein VFA50_22695 [Stellaceae bacterium]|nr:hypothetical protein [Stellaceae bacterium]